MSLADSIYEANNNLPKTSFSDELVSMAINNSIRNRDDEFSIYQLYRKGREIWHGHEEVKQTIANIYRLTGYEERIPVPIAINFWVKLLPRLPELRLDIIQISNNLFWDKNNGEIITKEEIYESQISTQES